MLMSGRSLWLCTINSVNGSGDARPIALFCGISHHFEYNIYNVRSIYLATHFDDCHCLQPDFSVAHHLPSLCAGANSSKCFYAGSDTFHHRLRRAQKKGRESGPRRIRRGCLKGIAKMLNPSAYGDCKMCLYACKLCMRVRAHLIHVVSHRAFVEAFEGSATAAGHR